MKNYKKATAATLAALTILLSACGGGSDSTEEAAAIELESAKKVIYFYGAEQNEHYAYYVESKRVENLNDDNETKLENSDSGKLFYWADENSETNATTDKVVMFASTFNLADANATWEDFYYLDHFDGDERHPHSNSEFDPSYLFDENNETNNTAQLAKKADALAKLNVYLQERETLKNSLEAGLASAGGESLCNFYSIEEHHEEDGVERHETFHYVLDTKGIMYKFEGNATVNYTNQSIPVSLNQTCETNKSGVSRAQEGVLVYFGGDEKKLHLVDSHGDGDMHVHSTWDIGEILGGKVVEMMVGIGELEGDEDHSDHDH